MAHWQTLIVVTVLDEVLRNINFKGVNQFRYKNNTTPKWSIKWYARLQQKKNKLSQKMTVFAQYLTKSNALCVVQHSFLIYSKKFLLL